jgi:DNA-binding CsgD family transcriptional regulator
VIDSAYGGGMFALPAFCIATSLVALVAVARKVSGPFGAEATESKSIAERFGLSPREAEVAALLAEGLSNASIGEKLFISTKTVETHVTNIYRKAGVDGRFAFLAKAGTAQ